MLADTTNPRNSRFPTRTQQCSLVLSRRSQLDMKLAPLSSVGNSFQVSIALSRLDMGNKSQQDTANQQSSLQDSTNPHCMGQSEVLWDNSSQQGKVNMMQGQLGSMSRSQDRSKTLEKMVIS